MTKTHDTFPSKTRLEEAEDEALTEALGERRELDEKRPFLEQRAKIIQSIREFWGNQEFLEVETPLRIRAPAPEEHIDAEPSGDRFLITSPELHMKRMLAAGYRSLFQICHCFRKGERGDLHLPEFTMIEWYRAGAGVEALMLDCENLVGHLAKAVPCYPKVTWDGHPVDLAPPWERITVAEAFQKYAGWSPGPRPDPDRFDLDLVEKVEPGLSGHSKPVFLTDYPASMAALARLCPTAPGIAERFELYIGGLELANAFAELTDAGEQRRRFLEEAKRREQAKKHVYPIDETFLQTMALGMEPCAGIALGVDRLVMLLAGAKTIDQIVAFATP